MKFKEGKDAYGRQWWIAEVTEDYEIIIRRARPNSYKAEVVWGGEYYVVNDNRPTFDEALATAKDYLLKQAREIISVLAEGEEEQ